MSGNAVRTQAIDQAGDRAVYKQIAGHLRQVIGKGRARCGSGSPFRVIGWDARTDPSARIDLNTGLFARPTAVTRALFRCRGQRAFPEAGLRRTGCPQHRPPTRNL